MFQNKMLYNSFFLNSLGIVNWRQLVNPFSHILKSVALAATNPFDLPNDLNLISVCIVILFLIYSWRKIPMGNWFFVLALFLIFTIWEAKWPPLISFSRHFLTFYPVFLYTARQKFSALASSFYLLNSIAIMIFFFVFYVFGFFIA